ncbi:MAG TPA: MgtC/SapB family protein, partial [Bdellovibrionota bacterium]|nr:MgtC/SapB family protein [Bdellovibrionota bacterium]
LALLCGGMVGIERQLKRKAAGMKTHMLISLGSCLYAIVASGIWDYHKTLGGAGDPSRVVAQIVSGVGFLGGGAIIQGKGAITGLTTAATIWVAAALGLCVGEGEGLLAVLVTILVVVALTMTSFFETRVLGHVAVYKCRLTMQGTKEECRVRVAEHLDRNSLSLDQMQTRADGSRTQVTVRYRGMGDDHQQFIRDLWGTAGVEEVAVE